MWKYRFGMPKVIHCVVRRRFYNAEENGIRPQVFPSGKKGNFLNVCLHSDVYLFQSLVRGFIDVYGFKVIRDSIFGTQNKYFSMPILVLMQSRRTVNHNIVIQ